MVKALLSASSAGSHRHSASESVVIAPQNASGSGRTGRPSASTPLIRPASSPSQSPPGRAGAQAAAAHQLANAEGSGSPSTTKVEAGWAAYAGFVSGVA